MDDIYFKGRRLEEFGNVLFHLHICHITAIYRSEKYQWNLTRDNIANRKQTKGDNSSARDIQSIFEIQDICIKSQLAVFIGYMLQIKNILRSYSSPGKMSTRRPFKVH